jgi:hypothetical protein
MVVLGFLARLAVRVLAVFSVAVIVLHNLADPVMASQFGFAAWVWNVLHQPGALLVAGVPVLAVYPLVPWFAVMAAGFLLRPDCGFGCAAAQAVDDSHRAWFDQVQRSSWHDRALALDGRAGSTLSPLPSLGGAMKPFPPHFGYDFWVVYAVWAGVVALLYPMCLWFARLKQRRRDWWFSYL